jgi:chemotaxis protein CheC
MESADLNHFAELQLDVLKEVGNIGAGSAATALSNLLGKPVDMRVPSVYLLPFEEIVDLLGGAEQIVTAVFLRTQGQAPGMMFWILKQESAARLLAALFPEAGGAGNGYTELELSALSEIGNILTGSYLSAMADLTKLDMQPTVPSVTSDMLGAVISVGMIQYGIMGDKALFIDTQFSAGGDSFECQLFLAPDPESFSPLFQALGVPLA